MAFITEVVTRPQPGIASIFGLPEVSELSPVFQGDFVYGLNTQLWNTATVSGTGATVDTNASRLRLQSGTDAAGYAYLTSRKILRYRAGQGTTVRFTPVFSAGAANSIQLFGVGTMVSNAPQDGFFIGYNGTALSIAHYNAGTPTFTAQASWNGDKVDGSAGTTFTWNPLLGTPFMIKYPYLGYGDILFFVQNPTNGNWVLIHTIRYANTSATVELTQPNLQFIGYTKNSGNTVNKLMYLGSVGAFISGKREFLGPKWAADNNKSGVTTETSIMGIKNCTTYNGVTNHGVIRLHSLSIATTGNGITVVRLKLNATIGGSPSFATISGTTADSGVTITSGNSVASKDTAGTTVAAGTYVFNLATGGNGESVIDLTPYDIFLIPGDILTVSGFATQAAEINVSLNWSEDA